MKKLISVLLAILMVFSVVTVAFAAEGEGAGAA
ncbi:MAG: surface glycoprotein, partial [Clostridia bacterium]|nr:surface glycoprotein [Clostridia bacterium]